MSAGADAHECRQDGGITSSAGFEPVCGSPVITCPLSAVRGSDTIGRKWQEQSAAEIRTEDAMNFEDAGKIIDGEVKKFVEFVEQKVRPKTRREMAQLLRKASKNLTKAAQSLEKQ